MGYCLKQHYICIIVSSVCCIEVPKYIITTCCRLLIRFKKICHFPNLVAFTFPAIPSHLHKPLLVSHDVVKESEHLTMSFIPAYIVLFIYHLQCHILNNHLMPFTMKWAKRPVHSVDLCFPFHNERTSL